MKTIETTILATLAEMQLFESAALTYAKRELQHSAAAHAHNALVEYAVHDQHGTSIDVCRVSCLTCGARATATRDQLRPLLDEAPEHIKTAWETVQSVLAGDDETKPLKVLIEVLFLNLSWEARQQVKCMLTDHQKTILTAMATQPDGAGKLNW